MSELASCTKAIIATAGNGTRCLPYTKAIEKVMMPIGNKPVIHYIVKNCFDAGVREFTFVVKKQPHDSQIKTYFSHLDDYEAALAREGKSKYLDELNDIIDQSSFTFLQQDTISEKAEYGTSVPLMQALNSRKVKLGPNEPFLYLYGDNVYHDREGKSTVKKFLDYSYEAGATAAMLVTEVDPSEVSNYGIVGTTMRNNVEILDRIIEKPSIQEAPTNLNNGGCFLLTRAIKPFVKRSMGFVREGQKEKQFTDAVNDYARKGNDIAVVRADEYTDYLDCGTPAGLKHATEVMYPQGL